MAYSQELASAIETYFNDNQYKYTKNDNSNDECVYVLRVKLHCKLQNMQELIIVRDDNFSVLGTIPIIADENHRLAAAEYLTRVNYNLRSGNFELNMLDGDIRYKTFSLVGDGPISQDLIKNTIVLPILMIERFADGLLSVLFDFSSPKEAFDAAILSH